MESCLNIPISTINKFITRYTKNELRNNKYSLAFFDNSALSPLKLTNNDGTENYYQQQNFINYCKSQKIRPISSIEIIGELVKKLPPNPNLKNKKITILKTLQQAGLLWSLPLSVILDLEYCNLQNSYPALAHDFLHVFSEYPLCRVDKDQRLKSYPCDRAWKYSLQSDRDTVTHNGDIEKWFEKQIINPSSLQQIQISFKEYKAYNGAANNKQISLPNITRIPFTHIWNELIKLHAAPKPNDMFDTLHGAFALSYCDYLITNDNGLYDKSKKVTENLGLKISILKPDEFSKKFEEIVHTL